ncbi:Translation initiation factor eIF-2B subunit gamma [Malassezia sp. CBS 17886]|nr:Translation initiation factor eIF-2B subunit gamma [Malassezia sp. CBS 17886]
MGPTQAPHAARFQPVIFSDAGSNLYPLCDKKHESIPKALVPVLNRPMVAYPLQWLVTAGFRTCLLVAPAAAHSALASALRALYLVPPSLARDGSETAAAGAAASAGHTNVAVTVGSQAMALPGADDPVDAGDAPVMHIELLPAGPEADEHVRSLQHPSASVTRTRWGTAQLLYWLAATRKLELDPLVVPVDLVAPHLPLAAFLAAYLGHADEPPCVSCLFYERSAGDGVGKERERDGPANMFTVYDRAPLRIHESVSLCGRSACDQVAVHEPLLVMDSDDVSDKNASDLELRMSLLWKHPHVRVSTSLLDARVYVLRLAPLLPLLEAHPELNNIAEQLVPFVIKCGWQTHLSAKAGWVVAPDPTSVSVCPPSSDDSGDRRGNSGSPAQWLSVADLGEHAPAYHPRSEVVIACLYPEARRPLLPHVAPDTERGRVPVDERFMARANTVPTYLECNRYAGMASSPVPSLLFAGTRPPISYPDSHPSGLFFGSAKRLLRQATANAPILAQYPLPAVAGSGAAPHEAPPASSDATGLIHPRAQLSAECIVGVGTRIDERATIKQSILGRNCTIGKNVRIMRSVLMDGVAVGDGAKLENCIVGMQAAIGDRSQLKETDVGPQYTVGRGVESKNEKLVAYEDDSDGESMEG